MIAVLFVLIPGLLGVWLIRRPVQVVIPLLIVGLRLWFWRNDSHQDIVAMTIYDSWLWCLMCLGASRLHPKLGLVTFLLLAIHPVRCLFEPVEMDCTGIVSDQRPILWAGLFVAAVAVFRPVRPPSGLSPE